MTYEEKIASIFSKGVADQFFYPDTGELLKTLQGKMKELEDLIVDACDIDLEKLKNDS